MLINDLANLLLEIPPVLAAQWGAWMFVGLLLSIWSKREKSRLVVHAPTSRQKSGVRAPAAARAAARPKTAAPLPSTDPFAELEQLLDAPSTDNAHRRPGENAQSHILTELPQQPAVMAAPQSLP